MSGSQPAMSPTELTDEAGPPGPTDLRRREGGGGRPGLIGRIPRLGVWSWSFVGFVLASIIVFTALAR